MKLKVKILEKEGVAPVPIPKAQTEGAAGLDLSASISAPVTIKPGDLAVIPTGIAAEIEKGYAGLILGRSGLGIKHGIHPSNGVGLIDSDYRGEICVGLCNVSDKEYTVAPFDRIAQLVIIKTEHVSVVETDVLGETERGSGGFGSTGAK
ncbi:MAG: dUTP diphosphatase [Clostridia bacterium]|nr:dUTP diphosphatase [Clostridia bacterium]